jgi:uncharacterized protein (DUF58 family)
VLQRALAILVLVLVAVVAFRVVVGFVTGLLWIVALVALVAAGLWAWSTLRRPRRKRDVERSSAREVKAAPYEDRVADELRRINEQLRQQGRL